MSSPHHPSPDPSCAGGACPGGTTRRRLLTTGGAAAAAASLAACGPGGTQEPAASGSSGSDDATTGTGTAAAGETRVPLADVPVGGSTYLDAEQLIVAQPTEGEVVAYDATCPHQGCMVSGTGEDGALVCPCHGSTFASEDGSVLSGPATTGLTTVEARVEDSDVVISG
ncbi:putative iron sulfur protein [Serinicoccus hydrothermalis]|uniref:Cytochrome bc1 complex Rieske iron-sulfur subunit n=1 Tax=Serinicoccus hydrothermalis TaxID=1758689 RepID=A0A1B1N889_9MICO|nr:Rieske (2Fe-2S) protein [Serinicoccus hydrothermalis]ANS77639.1 putative iron sulfur protein [Serinicoccus hydrothermalis]